MKKQLAFAQFGAAARRIGALALGLIICTLGPGLSASAQQGTFTTFDARFVPHGFLRARDGTFTTFDLPAGSFVVTSGPPSINPEGAITGNYLDASFVPHGFLHAPDGTFTTFNAPDASGTFANSINP